MGAIQGHAQLLLASTLPPLTAHRYWRIFVTQVGNPAQRILAIGWMGYFANIGDANNSAQSIGKTGTSTNAIQGLATVFAVGQPGATSNAATFADNGLSTTGPWWLAVDMGSAVLPKEIGLFPQPNSPENTQRSPVNFEIQWSDDNITFNTGVVFSGISRPWTIGTEYRFSL